MNRLQALKEEAMKDAEPKKGEERCENGNESGDRRRGINTRETRKPIEDIFGELETD